MTDKQTDKQTDRQAGSHTDRQAGRHQKEAQREITAQAHQSALARIDGM